MYMWHRILDMRGKVRERNIKKNGQNELIGQRTVQKFLARQRAFIAEQAVHHYSNIGHDHVLHLN